MLLLAFRLSSEVSHSEGTIFTFYLQTKQSLLKKDATASSDDFILWKMTWIFVWGFSKLTASFLISFIFYLSVWSDVKFMSPSHTIYVIPNPFFYTVDVQICCWSGKTRLVLFALIVFRVSFLESIVPLLCGKWRVFFGLILGSFFYFSWLTGSSGHVCQKKRDFPSTTPPNPHLPTTPPPRACPLFPRIKCNGVGGCGGPVLKRGNRTLN